MKRQIRMAIFAVFCGAIAVAVVTILLFMPMKGPFAAEDITAIEQAGTAIDLDNAPIWRLCSLPKIGRKTAEKIRQTQGSG